MTIKIGIAGASGAGKSWFTLALAAEIIKLGVPYVEVIQEQASKDIRRIGKENFNLPQQVDASIEQTLLEHRAKADIVLIESPFWVRQEYAKLAGLKTINKDVVLSWTGVPNSVEDYTIFINLPDQPTVSYDEEHRLSGINPVGMQDVLRKAAPKIDFLIHSSLKDRDEAVKKLAAFFVEVYLERKKEAPTIH